MNDISGFVVNHWQQLIIPAAVFAVVLALGLIARRILFNRLKGWAAGSKSQLDDIVIETLYGPFIWWMAILALHLATQSAPIPQRASDLLAKLFLVLWIVSLTLALSKLAGLLIRHRGRSADGLPPASALTQTLAKLFVVGGGLLVLLNTLGISITPILTALGVGGLAVALALQNTLSNLFAGIYMSIAGQVRTGDYIKLDTGEEGYVTDTDWRSTTLRVLANNLIVVPNAKLAEAIVTNYHLPEKRMSLLVPIGVSYDCDPDQIERILVEEALAAAPDVPGLLAEPAPFVRFIPGFGASSLDFTLICQVAEFVDQYLAQHELRKRIFKRFRKENIEIPFPIRTVYLKNSGTAPAEASHEQNGLAALTGRPPRDGNSMQKGRE